VETVFRENLSLSMILKYTLNRYLSLRLWLKRKKLRRRQYSSNLTLRQLNKFLVQNLDHKQKKLTSKQLRFRVPLRREDLKILLQEKSAKCMMDYSRLNCLKITRKSLSGRQLRSYLLQINSQNSLKF